MTISLPKFFGIIVSVAIFFVSSASLSGQITVKIPKIPKITKDEPRTSTSDNSGGSSTQNNLSYDKETFQSIYGDTGYDEFGGYSRYISPYLNCYGKKHNIPQKTIDIWPKMHGGTDEESLAVGQQRLADLETKLKARMRSFPHTGLGPGENPGLTYEIASKRAEYLQCLRGGDKAATAASTDCSSDPVAQVHLMDLEKTRKEAEEFRPGARDYFVSTLSDGKNLYLEAALSPSKREEWLGRFRKNDPQFEKCMAPALDGLAAVARKTLPGYTGPAGYTLGTPPEKAALQRAINDIAGAKVLKVGIKQPNWLIEKNSLGIPTARYRHGVIWAQYPNNDTGLCWIFWVNLVQDYAGGGTYGASYGNYISRAVAGCPRSN